MLISEHHNVKSKNFVHQSDVRCSDEIGWDVFISELIRAVIVTAHYKEPVLGSSIQSRARFLPVACHQALRKY